MESFVTLKFERELINKALFYVSNPNIPLTQALEVYLKHLATECEEQKMQILPPNHQPINRIDDFISKHK